MKPIGCKEEAEGQLFYRAAEVTPIRLLITDSEGIVVYANPSFLKLSGISKAEVLGSTVSSFLETDKLKSVLEEVKTLQNEGEVYRKSLRVGYKNAPQLNYEVTIQPLENTDTTHFLFEFFEPENVTKREDELERMLNERETLIKEIHHRVKNNLAVISGLLTLQKFSYEDDRLFELLSDSEMRIKSMALIHEKLYRSSTLASIELSAYLEDLIESIRQTLTKRTNISIEVDCESIHLNVNQAVPSALIVNEIISNSYKYAYPDNRNGVIRVHVFKEEKKIHFIAEDDGVGLPDDFEERRVSSLGFTIIDTLVSQLEAKLNVKSDNGTRLHFYYKHET
jgi:PAS domain S-box-containing protein